MFKRSPPARNAPCQHPAPSSCFFLLPVLKKAPAFWKSSVPSALHSASVRSVMFKKLRIRSPEFRTAGPAIPAPGVVRYFARDAGARGEGSDISVRHRTKGLLEGSKICDSKASYAIKLSDPFHARVLNQSNGTHQLGWWVMLNGSDPVTSAYVVTFLRPSALVAQLVWFNPQPLILQRKLTVFQPTCGLYHWLLIHSLSRTSLIKAMSHTGRRVRP